MTGYCKVEFDALVRLVTELGECADSMRSAMKQLKDIGPAGAGSKELEAACDEFQHKWGYGIKQIAKATDGVTGKVAKSGQLYQELEDKIEALMKAVQAGGR